MKCRVILFGCVLLSSLLVQNVQAQFRNIEIISGSGSAANGDINTIYNYNNNGSESLLIYNNNYWSSLVLRSNGDGTFTSEGNLIYSSENLMELTPFNADGNGNMQLFLSGATYTDTARLDEIRYTVNGNTALLTTDYMYFKASAGDIDSDGDDDLIFFTDDDIEFGCKWLENQNNGTSWQLNELVLDGGSNAHSNYYNILDIDDDDDNDLITYSSGSKIIANLNNGSEVFSTSFEIADYSAIEIQHIHPLYSKDVDGDGFNDILFLFATEEAYQLSWFKNNNDGTFDNEVVIAYVPHQFDIFNILYYDMQMMDLNQDGLNDFLIGADTINVFLNQGNSWVKEYQIEELSAPFDIMDIDNDSDYDVVAKRVMSFNEIELVWIENVWNDSATYVEGYVFRDENSNGIFDLGIFGAPDEDILAGVELTVQPGNISVFTDENGYYSIAIDEPGDYTLTSSQPLIFNCDYSALVSSQFTVPENGSIDVIYEKYLVIQQDVGLIPEVNSCVTLSGRVFNDLEGNGTFDNNDYWLQGIKVNANDQVAFTNQYGRYYFEFGTGQTVNISVDTFLELSSYCTDSFYNFIQTYPQNPNYWNVSTSTSTFSSNFGLLFPPFFDAAIITLFPYYGNEAGETFNAWIDFKTSATNAENCTLRIEHDPLLTLLSSDINSTQSGANFVEWVFPPGAAPYFYCMHMQWHLDSTAIEGELLHWEASFLCDDNIDDCPGNNVIVRDVEIINGPLERVADDSLFSQLRSMNQDYSLFKF